MNCRSYFLSAAMLALTNIAFAQQILTDELRSAQKKDTADLSAGVELKLSTQEMKWWRDAKLGVFVHWGLYAIPAKGEWYMFNDKVPAADYAKLADQFTPRHYNPEDWANLAKGAGAGYMVMTARHHDGFAMFDSKTSYGQFDSGHSAAHTDFIGEYVKAVRSKGLKVGIYYSPMDWRFPGYFHPDTMPENAELMKKQGYGQIQELMSNYGQVDILWYDGGWLAHKGTDADAAWFWKPVELNSMVRKLQPKAVISPRSGWQGDFNVEEGDHPISGLVREKPWEKTFSLNRSAWGYTADNNTLPVARVIRLFVDAAVRNGNILINMSPNPDGVIPDGQVTLLKDLGLWTQKYGRSLFGTRPGPYQPVDDSYGSTCIGKKIFLHVVGWPNKTIVLPSQPFRILSAKNLTGGKVTFEQGSAGVSITVPDENRDAVDTIIQLDVDRNVTSLAPQNEASIEAVTCFSGVGNTLQIYFLLALPAFFHSISNNGVFFNKLLKSQ